ncbi:hypothetical protein [Mixta intestinalis]|uniref:Lipoprotein n=1 Tax=Mixta intestinalis TaxID=1615494 RepID=A0A6P1PXE4_9GAMM|nr:hypothetical protein [Mixta intestinalis]QHM70772.1 hypothetical protein C7M51_01051 [Mixta intestinalis]
MLRVMVLTLPLLLAACSSSPPGVECAGSVATLYGEETATTHGTIFDLVNSFSVANEKVKVESGPLHSNDRSRYIPAAVTKEGYLAQRISDRQFRLIDPQQDKMITYTCENSSHR